jgi:CheY-like chemotaxis protein
MEPDRLETVFESFRQVEENRGRSRGGLGLGLALVKGLVEMHVGRVWAESVGRGTGSTFKIRLPLTTAPESSSASEQTPVSNQRRCRILIIEDDADAAESFRMLLQACGHQVGVALDGPAAFELAHQLRPEVVLCDLGLPGSMDGHAVARALRGDSDLAGARLVALSGYGQEEDQRRSAESGFDRHLTKPVGIQELQRVVDELMSNR